MEGLVLRLIINLTKVLIVRKRQAKESMEKPTTVHSLSLPENIRFIMIALDNVAIRDSSAPPLILIIKIY